ncbi:Glycosyl transferase/GT4 [Candidatus Phaeomarinobacter ectocarpi]|uniref:Glycosyl transferase/GT4 n=1 Tax=Candidatus Phaeomarinibacter ectocarpi TaxID=1458461 RepID=X5M7E8_9HYPH|nr:glycosyltransferase [Candidatus Phaeomarinobacter ectocarpi]CDO59068.1 Glycosyl transferase/GT4 [Candidatus Phaeomarinobacter ectocarpi]
MRRLLIVSPHFPPTDAADMHRVRGGVNFYARYGWEPAILAISPETAGRPIEERLTRTVPDDLPIQRVDALGVHVTRHLGLTASGLRGWVALARAGSKLLASGTYDLIYISTTQFPIMTLGRYWQRRFGVPFVLDFQDPWFNAEFVNSQRSRQLKHRFMRAVHRKLEAMTVPHASGIISVSQKYIDVFRRRYPGLADVPAAEVPFGFNPKDIEVLQAIETPLVFDKTTCTGFYAGRAGAESVDFLRLLMKALSSARQQWPDVFGAVRLQFVGTKYSNRETQAFVTAAAREFGVSEAVQEQGDRIPYFNALDATSRADFNIVLGSNDPAYRPSKLAILAEMGKPVVAAVGRDSVVERALGAFPQCAIGLLPDGEAGFEDAAASLAGLWREVICGAGRVPSPGPAKIQVSEAEKLAQQECRIFDRAVARS